MTREKANNIARGITDKIEATTDIDDWAEFWGFTRDDYEEFLDMAIKALEQDIVPFDFELYQAGLMDMSKGMIEVLDKIRAEIIENSIEDYKYHGCGTDELIIETSEVLRILDKYKAESEG